MLKNMSTIDRVIRAVIAAVFVWMYFTGRIEGVIGILLLVVSAVFLLTSIRGFCPGYLLFRKKPI